VPRAGAGLWRWSSATGSYETACSAPVISVAVNASESGAGAVQVHHRGDAVWPGLTPGRPARCTTADPGRPMVATSRHDISPGLGRPLGAQGAPQVACVKKRYNLSHPGVQHTTTVPSWVNEKKPEVRGNHHTNTKKKQPPRHQTWPPRHTRSPLMVAPERRRQHSRSSVSISLARA